MVRRIGGTWIPVVLGLLLGASQALAGDVAYTRFNIHLQEEKDGTAYQASYSGWVEPPSGHAILPAGSEVRVEAVGGKLWKKGGVSIIVPDPAKVGLKHTKVFLEVDTKLIGLSLEEYQKIILSDSPVSLSGFSSKDLEGIKAGKAQVGMTKKGVMAALGYPAPHRTPNPDTDTTWVYWAHRMRSFNVNFDAKGIVISTR